MVTKINQGKIAIGIIVTHKRVQVLFIMKGLMFWTTEQCLMEKEHDVKEKRTVGDVGIK